MNENTQSTVNRDPRRYQAWSLREAARVVGDDARYIQDFLNRRADELDSPSIVTQQMIRAVRAHRIPSPMADTSEGVLRAAEKAGYLTTDDVPELKRQLEANKKHVATLQRRLQEANRLLTMIHARGYTYRNEVDIARYLHEIGALSS